MRNFSTWMILMISIIFWILRIITTYTFSMGMDFMTVPMDLNMEIALLFVALICFVLIVKRKLFGALIYLITYGAYFGMDLLNNVTAIMAGGAAISDYTTLLFSFAGVVIPIATVFDILLDKNRMAHPTDKKTDWFYKGEKYDRKLDERADKNNYRTM